MDLSKELKQTFLHVDDWLDTPTFTKDREKEPNIDYAKMVIEFLRLPSFKQENYRQYLQQFELFCFIEGNPIKQKVVFASRMGHIGLRDYFSHHHSYERLACVENCHGWSPN